MSIGNVYTTNPLPLSTQFIFPNNIIQLNILTDEAIKLFWNLIRKTSCLQNILRYTRT